MKVTGVKELLISLRERASSITAEQSQKIQEKLVEKLKEATPVDTGYARDAWRVKDSKIVNEAPYISELNAGSSKQAPSYFIEKTVLADSDVRPDGAIVIYR
jgi:hypothetical protein